MDEKEGYDGKEPDDCDSPSDRWSFASNCDKFMSIKFKSRLGRRRLGENPLNSNRGLKSNIRSWQINAPIQSIENYQTPSLTHPQSQLKQDNVLDNSYQMLGIQSNKPKDDVCSISERLADQKKSSLQKYLTGASPFRSLDNLQLNSESDHLSKNNDKYFPTKNDMDISYINNSFTSLNKNVPMNSSVKHEATNNSSSSDLGNDSFVTAHINVSQPVDTQEKPSGFDCFAIKTPGKQLASFKIMNSPIDPLAGIFPDDVDSVKADETPQRQTENGDLNGQKLSSLTINNVKEQESCTKNKGMEGYRSNSFKEIPNQVNQITQIKTDSCTDEKKPVLNGDYVFKRPNSLFNECMSKIPTEQKQENCFKSNPSIFQQERKMPIYGQSASDMSNKDSLTVQPNTEIDFKIQSVSRELFTDNQSKTERNGPKMLERPNSHYDSSNPNHAKPQYCYQNSTNGSNHASFPEAITPHKLDFPYQRFNSTPKTVVSTNMNNTNEATVVYQSQEVQKPAIQQTSTPYHAMLSQINKPKKETKEAIYINNIPYRVLTLLGKGGSSKVYQVLGPNSNLLAIKCVNLATAEEFIAKGYLNEIELLSKLQGCPSVIRMFDHEFVQESKMLYVVMEIGDIDFSKLIKNINETKKVSMPMIFYYWTEILHAVKAIHEQGIIHSDLKPANFLLVNGRLKLIDFGIASSLQGDMTSVLKDVTTGTFNYISPEAITTSGEGAGYKITYKSDIWSLGCILYNLLYGRTPFSHLTQVWAKLQAIADPNIKISYPKLPAEPPLTLMLSLRLCLLKDPKARPTASDLLQISEYSPFSEKSLGKYIRQSMSEHLMQVLPNLSKTISEMVRLIEEDRT